MTTNVASVLPDCREQPLSDLNLLVAVGLAGRSTVYEGAKNGTLPIPVIRVGRLYRIRTIDVYRLVGVSVPGENASPAGEV